MMLAEKLYSALMNMIGSDEHLHIAGLLKSADRVMIDKDSAVLTQNLVHQHPIEIESNLDIVEWPTKPLWVQWPLETVSGHGGGDDAVTGCLVAPFPEFEDLIAIVTGWESAGIARHSYAVAVIDKVDLRERAWAAKKWLKGKSPEASIERMMESIQVYMPPGFKDEIEILSDGDANACEAAMRDATGELPFILAYMVLRHANGGLQLEGDQDYRVARLETSPKLPILQKVKGFFSASSRSLLRRHRIDLNGRFLSWHR